MIREIKILVPILIYLSLKVGKYPQIFNYNTYIIYKLYVGLLVMLCDKIGGMFTLFSRTLKMFKTFYKIIYER